MTEKPILFSAPMVLALLDGRKTQTRRCGVRDFLRSGVMEWNGREMQPLPSYAPGDRLWVKETWRPSINAADPWHVAVLYPHNGEVKHWGWSTDADFGDWNIPKAAAKGNVTPLFMPRWASRLTLIVTDVRVQRLQEINEADAIAEGVYETWPGGWDFCRNETCFRTPVSAFANLWNSIHGPDAWVANPWVCALTFDVHRCNIAEAPK